VSSATDGFLGLLHEPAEEGQMELLNFLLEAGRDLNQRVDYGPTALGLEASRGHIAIIRRLVEAGAEVNAYYSFNRTTLIRAASKGRTEVVDCLIEAGADPGISAALYSSAFEAGSCGQKEAT